jgi:ABC-type dipeptide/oligopeptide/nickel transport system permease subunit
MFQPTAHNAGLRSRGRVAALVAQPRHRGVASDYPATRPVVGPSLIAWHRFRQDTVAVVAFAVCALIVGFALSADVIATVTGHPYHAVDLHNRLHAPLSPGHLLGTDAHGRDVLVRLAYGGRVSLLVAGLAATATLALGGAVGIVAGYAGGAVDAVAMRLVDVLLSLPGLSLLILIGTLYGPGPIGLALVLAALGWMPAARLVRAEVLTLRRRGYVEAARVAGASDARIAMRHVLPNVAPTLVVWASLAVPGLILTEAALSFLGFGVRIPIPSWGNMLQDAKDFYTLSWTNVAIPGLLIYVTVLAITLVGDGLRDAFDPRLRG